MKLFVGVVPAISCSWSLVKRISPSIRNPSLVFSTQLLLKPAAAITAFSSWLTAFASAVVVSAIFFLQLVNVPATIKTKTEVITTFVTFIDFFVFYFFNRVRKQT